MSIRLRVTGIFFDEEIEFAKVTAQLGAFVLPGRISPTVDLLGVKFADDRVTILELMEAARVERAKAGKPFTFAFDRRFKPSGEGFLSMISIGHELDPQINLSLGGQRRPAGFYHLTETPIPNGVVAWQNYVIRNGVSVSSLRPNEVSPPMVAPTDAQGFTTFDQAVLEDGDTVVWQMVAIQLSPAPRSRRESEQPQMMSS